MGYITPKWPRIMVSPKDHKKLFFMAKKSRTNMAKVVAELLKKVK